MTDDNMEQLARDYPAIFEKSKDFEFSIGDGWYTILDVLFGMLSYKYESAQSRLKYARENPDARMNMTMDELEKTVETEYNNLPAIAQVKEKFGSLRFYVDGGTEEMHNFIEFAEAMSTSTCEVCGSPGKSRNDGWIKTLCDNHYTRDETVTSPPLKSMPATFSDEL